MASIRSIPSTIPKDIAAVLGDLRLAVQGMTGVSGSLSNKALTRTDLVSLGLAQWRRKEIITAAGANSDIEPIGGPPVTAKPPAITNFRGTAFIGGVLLRWDPISYPGHEYVELWRSQDGNRSNAIMIARVPQNISHYADSFGQLGQVHYWVFPVSTGGTHGPFTYLAIESIGDAGYIVGQLQRSIKESELYPALNTRISLIDTPVTGLVAVTAGLQTDMTTAQGDIIQNASDITTLQSTVNNPSTGVAANATAITALDTRVTTAEGTIIVNSTDITRLTAEGGRAHGIFAAEFSADYLSTDWLDTNGAGSRASITPAGASAVLGGKVLEVTGGLRFRHKDLIPFDPNKLYRIKTRVRQPNGTDQFAFGWTGVQADGVTLIGYDGTVGSENQVHWHGHNGLGPGNTYTDYEGYTQGYGATVGTNVLGTAAVPGKMHPLVAYMIPCFFGNTGHSGTAIYEFDYFLAEDYTALDKATAISGLDTRVTITEGSITTNANAITALETTVNDGTSGVAANAAAVVNLNATTSTNTGNITSNSNAITALETTVNNPTTGVAANAAAITTLNATTSTNAGNITTNASAITAVSATITGYVGPQDANLIVDSNFALKVTDGFNYWPNQTNVAFGTFGENSSSGVQITTPAANLDLYPQAYFPARVGDKFFVRARVFLSATFNSNFRVLSSTHDYQKANLLNWNGAGNVSTPLGSWFWYTGTITVTNNNAAFVKIGPAVVGVGTPLGTVSVSELYVSRVESGADITATASAFTTLDATVTSQGTSITANASAITTLQSDVSGNTASITTEATTRATNDGLLNAEYVLKLDVNGHVAGFGVAVSGGASGPIQSEFLIRANKFAIVFPGETWAVTTAYTLNAYVIPTAAKNFQYRASVGGTSAGTEPTWPLVIGNTVVDGTVTWTTEALSSGDVPFVVGLVNGVTTVGIDGALVVNGTIIANAINVTNLAAIKSDLGAITAGTITLDSTGHIKSGQTGYDTGTGWWLGKDAGTAKFSIGNSAAERMTWDGTAITVVGTIQTAVGTGKRIVLDSSLNNFTSYSALNVKEAAIGSTASVPGHSSASSALVWAIQPTTSGIGMYAEGGTAIEGVGTFRAGVHGRTYAKDLTQGVRAEREFGGGPALFSTIGFDGTGSTSGTISVTNGSASVTGVGTNWGTGTLPNGLALQVTGDTTWYDVLVPIFSTSLTLATNYTGTTGSGKTYRLGIKDFTCHMYLGPQLGISGAPYWKGYPGMFYVNQNGSLYYNKLGTTSWTTIVA